MLKRLQVLFPFASTASGFAGYLILVLNDPAADFGDIAALFFSPVILLILFLVGFAFNKILRYFSRNTSEFTTQKIYIILYCLLVLPPFFAVLSTTQAKSKLETFRKTTAQRVMAEDRCHDSTYYLQGTVTMTSISAAQANGWASYIYYPANLTQYSVNTHTDLSNPNNDDYRIQNLCFEVTIIDNKGNERDINYLQNLINQKHEIKATLYARSDNEKKINGRIKKIVIQ